MRSFVYKTKRSHKGRLHCILLRCFDREVSGRSDIYGMLNSMRSAIASINTCNTAENPDVNGFRKGVFKMEPSIPKHERTTVTHIRSRIMVPSRIINSSKIDRKINYINTFKFNLQSSKFFFSEIGKHITKTRRIRDKTYKHLLKTSEPDGSSHSLNPYYSFFIKSNPQLCIESIILF